MKKFWYNVYMYIPKDIFIIISIGIFVALYLVARELDSIKNTSGDFLPVLKHLKEIGKEVVILSRGPRTAKEIRQFAGSNFRDFEYLKFLLKME